MNEGEKKVAQNFQSKEAMSNNANQYSQLDEILEEQQKKKEVKPKKQINPAEAQIIYKCLKQSRDQITQQNYQDCAYILTKIPIFQYVYSVKGLSFITEFLKNGQLMEVSQNNHTLYDKDGSYIQRFFLLIKGSVAFEGTVRKSKNQIDQVKTSPKYSFIGYNNSHISPKVSQTFLTTQLNINNNNPHQEGVQSNRINTLEQFEDDFDDRRSAVFKLDSQESDTDDDDGLSISSQGSFSKKSSSPPHSYNQDFFLSSNKDGYKSSNKQQKASNFAKSNKRRPSSYAQLDNEYPSISQNNLSKEGYDINQSQNNLSQEQDDFIKAQNLINPNFNENNYMIQINRPDSNTPQKSERDEGNQFQYNSSSRKSSSRIIEIEIPQDEGNIYNKTSQQDLDSDQRQPYNKQKQISSQRLISMPTQNKIRSSSQVSKRRESLLSLSSSKNRETSQQSLQSKHSNLLSVSKNDQLASMRRKSNFMPSNKASHNNSVQSSLHFQEQLMTSRSQRSLGKTSNNIINSKKFLKKKKKVVVLERFRTVNSVNAFGHKFKIGKHRIHKIVTASEKCVLMSFTMKDFEDLIYGMDESNGEIKLIKNIINKQYLFKACSFRQINNLAFMSRRQKYIRDETIYSQKDKSKGIYFVLSGEVKILIDTKDVLNNQNNTRERTDEGSNRNSQSNLSSNQNQLSIKLINHSKGKILSNEDEEEGQTHELFIHKNKNKLKGAQQKFTEKHQKEVGILGEGSFFGLEELVLGKHRSSTIQVNSREAEILYIPIDHSDIFIYLDDEARKDIQIVAQSNIDQRRKRAVSNMSLLSQGIQQNAAILSSSMILNQTNQTQFMNNKIYTNQSNMSSQLVTQQNFHSQQNRENNIDNQQTKSQSPNRTNIQNRTSISPPLQRGQTTSVQPSNISQQNNQNKNIQIPAKFSKAAKLDDLLIKYPNQASKITPTKQQPELMINNEFSVFDANPNDFNKSVYLQNDQKELGNDSKLQENQNNQKTNTSLRLGQSQFTQNVDTQEEQKQRSTSRTKIEPLEISDLVKSREIRQKRTETNTREVSPRKKKQQQNLDHSNDQNEKVNDLIQYYNLKKLEDAKTLKRRSFSCFIEGEKIQSEGLIGEKENSQLEDKKQATTLDPKDIQNENIIWKKDIIMSNTEYSPLNVKNSSQQANSINTQNQNLQIQVSQPISNQKNLNQILLPYSKQQNVQALPTPTAQFQNNLINSNLSAKYVDPAIVKQKVDNMFYYPNKNTYLRENNLIPPILSQSVKNNDRLLTSSQGSRIQQKRPESRNTTKNNKSQLLSQENSLNVTQVFQINIKNSKQNSKSQIIDENIKINNKFLHPPSLNLTKERSNKRYSQTENKLNPNHPSHHASSLSNLDDESISFGLQQISLTQENTQQMRSGLQTAQQGKRQLGQNSDNNRMSAPQERSFRIQVSKGKNKNIQEECSPTKQNKSEQYRNKQGSPLRQKKLEFSPNNQNQMQRAQSTHTSTRNKILSKSQMRQQGNNQKHKITASEVAMLNMSDIQFNKLNKNQSRISPRLNESGLEIQQNTEQQRVKRKMNSTAFSCLSMKQSDNFNIQTPQLSTNMSISRRPFSNNNNRKFDQVSEYQIIQQGGGGVDEKFLNELKVKQEIENMVINPTFKLSNNFQFYHTYLKEQEGIFDVDENIEQQIEVKKNLLNHIYSHSNKANSGKQSTSSEFKKSYVQKYIYPEDAFAREADQKIKIQQNKLQEEKNSNPYLCNTKFEDNCYSSFLMFDDYKKRKLKYFHKNKNLYSGNSKALKPEEQTPIRPLHVQTSAAVKNNKRRLKNSRKSQIETSQVFVETAQLVDQNEQNIQQNQQLIEKDSQNEQNPNSTFNQNYLLMQEYNELGYINQQFSKTFHDSDPYFSQFKNRQEIKQRQKDILHQFQTQKKEIKQKKESSSSRSQPSTPQLLQ